MVYDVGISSNMKNYYTSEDNTASEFSTTPTLISSILHSQNLGEETIDPKISKTASKLVFQSGSSEVVSAADWLYSGKTIVASMGLKSVKIFDLRIDPSPPIIISSQHTKSVLGISCDPFIHHQFATYSEDSIIKIWDSRRAVEPVLSINSEFRDRIGNIQWSPSRAGYIVATGKDSSIVKVWHIQNHNIPPLKSTFSSQTASIEKDQNYQFDVVSQLLSNITYPPSTSNSESEDLAPRPIISKTHSITPIANSPVSQISWIPSKKHRLKLLTVHGQSNKFDEQTFKQTSVFSSPIFSWSPTGEIATFNDSFVRIIPKVDDISVDMRDRAINGYTNESLGSCEFGLELKNIWDWVYRMCFLI